MFNPKNLILPFLGLLSGIAAGTFYQYNDIVFGPVGIACIGLIFAIFMSAGIYFLYNTACKTKCYILFIVFSAIAYFASFWIAALFSEQLGGLVAFALAGIAGGALMLAGIRSLLPLNFKHIIALAILGGLLAVISLLINFYIIRGGDYTTSMMSVGDDFSASIMEPAGLYLLHILWNTIMAWGIAIVSYKKLK